MKLVRVANERVWVDWEESVVARRFDWELVAPIAGALDNKLVAEIGRKSLLSEF